MSSVMCPPHLCCAALHLPKKTSARAKLTTHKFSRLAGACVLDTTHVYAEVDLEMKAKALARCDVPQPGWAKLWRKDAGIIGILRAL
jgi:hypothetical protein